MRERIYSGTGFMLTDSVVAAIARRTERPLIRNSFSPIVRWAFYAFVFSLLFEAVPFGIPVEVTQITGAFLAIAAFLQPNICFRRSPKAFWCFVAYLFAAVISLISHRALLNQAVISRLSVLIQLLFMFYIAYNVMRNERVARGALKSLIASCVVFSILSLLNLTSTTHEKLINAGRFTAFGLDPNQLAGILSLGVLTLIGFNYGLDRRLLRLGVLTWPILILVGVTLVSTGSRGGLLALGVGLLTFVLRNGNISAKARSVLIVLLGIGFFFFLSYQSKVVNSRFEKTIETGDTTARSQIYTVAFRMFLEKPLIGWGPLANRAEIAARVGIPRFEELDAHNVILNVLTGTGIIGAIPFFIGIGLCVRSAWKARGGVHGILPFAMVVAMLMASLSVSGLDWKQFWLVLAYALASSEFGVFKSAAPNRSRLGEGQHPFLGSVQMHSIGSRNC